jgi:hypothetical protein
MAATRRFKVVVQTTGTACGHYEFLRRASSPVEAINKAMQKLSLDDINEAPFLVTVEPKGEVRHG